MRKRYLIFFLTFLLAAFSWAQKLTIQAPRQAEVGKRIQVRYVLNTDSYDNIEFDDDITGFDVQYGPSISTSHSISIINGQASQSATVTFTYTLMPLSEGNYTLPAAIVSSGGQKIKSQTARIEVLPASATVQRPNGNGGGQQGRGATQSANLGSNISASDIFFTTSVTKTRVFEQEAIHLTYTLNSRLSVEQLTGEMPQLDGFHTEEIAQSQQKSFTQKNINGINYGTVVWSEYILFPQRTGKLTIPPIEFVADVIVQNRVIDPIEAFFNGGGIMQRVQKKVKAPAVEITVDALPQRPANFSGAVGKNFSVSGKLSPQQIDANDATTLSVTISGTGNMRLMKAPAVAWPHDFEEYDPKRQEKTKITTNGIQGTVGYEYVAVPHHAGKYIIPAVEFCYFDTDKKQYVTLQTDSFELGVAKVEGAVASATERQQEEIKQLGEDIRYIKKGEVALVAEGETMFGSSLQLYWYVGVLLFFLVVMLFFRLQAKMNADVVGQRGRRASKAAVKRLREANKLLKAGDAEHFYDEVLRALWGYVADKLNLPVLELNKDNISEKLQQRAIDEDTTLQFLNILSDCEFARFAPGDPNTNMENMYNAASDIIGRIEDKIQR